MSKAINKDKVQIKQATSSEDIQTLAKTAEDIWNEYFPFLLEEGQISYMLDKFLSTKALTEQKEEGYEFYFLVDETGNILGFFVIHPEDNKLFLSKIYLYDTYRNQQLATIMMDYIFNRAKELGLDKVYLTVNKYNLQPISVYKHLGFKTIDSVVTDIGNGYVMDDYIMQKQL